MANLTSQYRKNSSSNYYYQATKDVAARSNIQASAYTVDAFSMALKGFHYSTCGAGGTLNFCIFDFPSHFCGPGGGFEVSTGIPSPPPSPRATPVGGSSPNARPGLKARSRSGGAAYTITEECERLFCETLKVVFLGEGNAATQDSLVMGMRNNEKINNNSNGAVQPLPSPSPSADSAIELADPAGAVVEWVEIWEYAEGLEFRGFVADKAGERTLFVFFEKGVIGNDLKNGLMALLELSGGDDFGCSKLVACLDRSAEAHDIKDLTRDLGWVGFELTTLDQWSDGTACTSDKWLLLEMEV